MTSNPLSGKQHEGDCWDAQEVIERLTAELAGTKDELHSVDKAAKELGAERDRLRLERDVYKRFFDESCNGNLKTWARKQLAGEDRPKDRPADETTPVREPCVHMPCEKHRNMPYTFTVTATTVPIKTKCFICEPQ